MKLADLVAAHQRSSEIAQQQAALKAMVKDVGNIEELRELRAMVDGLDDDGRAQVIAILRGQRVTPPANETDDDEDDLLATPAKKNGIAAPNALELRLAKMEEAMRAVVQDVVTRRTGERQSAMQQQVDALLESFEVLKTDATARKYVRENVLAELGQRPDTNPEQAAARHAATLKEIMAASRRSAMPAPLTNRTELPRPEKPFSGQDMRDGKIRSAVADVLARLP